MISKIENLLFVYRFQVIFTHLIDFCMVQWLGKQLRCNADVKTRLGIYFCNRWSVTMNVTEGFMFNFSISYQIVSFGDRVPIEPLDTPMTSSSLNNPLKRKKEPRHLFQSGLSAIIKRGLCFEESWNETI